MFLYETIYRRQSLPFFVTPSEYIVLKVLKLGHSMYNSPSDIGIRTCWHSFEFFIVVAKARNATMYDGQIWSAKGHVDFEIFCLTVCAFIYCNIPLRFERFETRTKVSCTGIFT